MRRECRERFPRYRLQGKPLVSDPGMDHDTCVTHVPWSMSGSLTRGGGESVPGIPGACATRNFYVSGNRPMIERPSRYVYVTKLYPCYSLWSLNKLRTYEYSIIAFYSDDCEWIKKRVATIIILELECVIYNDMHIMHDRNTDNLRYQEYLFFVMCMLCYEKKYSSLLCI